MAYELIKSFLVQPKASARKVSMHSNRETTLKIMKSILTENYEINFNCCVIKWGVGYNQQFLCL